MKLKSFVSALCFCFAGFSLSQAQQLKTFDDSLSYVVGVDIAKNLSKMDINLDPDMLAAGYKAQMNSQSILSDDDIAKVMEAYQKKAMEKMGQPEMPPPSDPAKLARNEAWLAENAKKEGVMTTTSGLQYKALVKGKKKGKAPGPQDEVTVNYEGHFLDGTEFDSSYKRGEPITFPVYGVIPGWQEALQLMNPGSKYEVYVPAALGYGPGGMPPTIPPDELLIFTIELISVQKAGGE